MQTLIAAPAATALSLQCVRRRHALRRTQRGQACLRWISTTSRRSLHRTTFTLSSSRQPPSYNVSRPRPSTYRHSFSLTLRTRGVAARAAREDDREEEGSATSVDMDALRKRLESMQEKGLDRELVEKESPVQADQGLVSNDQFGYLFLLLLLVAGFLLLKVAILY